MGGGYEAGESGEELCGGVGNEDCRMMNDEYNELY